LPDAEAEGYQRPFVGFLLPAEWMSPTATMIDPRKDSLPIPKAGLRWWRYHSDAVLTDREGRVVDMRIGHWRNPIRPGTTASGMTPPLLRAPAAGKEEPPVRRNATG
jgi:hypothetical protein